jgi:hypothetical protein
LSDNYILESIKPKSDQLNSDDLIAGPIDVTILDVKRGDEQQPVAVVIDGGYQPYKPCKSMRRVLVTLFGDNPKQWIGKRLRLFCDPSVKFGGVKVGGIRISHATIEQPKEVLLTVAKAKRSVFTVEPMPEVEKPNAEIETRFSKAMDAIWKADSTAKLDKYRDKIEAELLDSLTVEQRKQVMEALATKWEELQ